MRVISRRLGRLETGLGPESQRGPRNLVVLTRGPWLKTWVPYSDRVSFVLVPPSSIKLIFSPTTPTLVT